MKFVDKTKHRKKVSIAMMERNSQTEPLGLHWVHHTTVKPFMSVDNTNSSSSQIHDHWTLERSCEIVMEEREVNERM